MKFILALIALCAIQAVFGNYLQVSGFVLSSNSLLFTFGPCDTFWESNTVFVLLFGVVSFFFFAG